MIGESVFLRAPPLSSRGSQAVSAEELHIVIDSIFSLDEARAALEKVATGHARGKVTIRTRN